MSGGIGVGCKSSELVSFVIAPVNMGMTPKFAFEVFHLCADDSLFKRAGVFEFFFGDGCRRGGRIQIGSR